MDQELYKLAESIEALAETIAREASEAEQPANVTKRASLEYGTLGDEYNPGGTDAITRFVLGDD